MCDVDYAILEENGKMSVIPKNASRQPDKTDMNVECDDDGIMHIIISDGCVNTHGLKTLQKDRAWLDGKLKKLKLPLKSILCMTVDDVGKIFIQTHDGKQIIKEEGG